MQKSLSGWLSAAAAAPHVHFVMREDYIATFERSEPTDCVHLGSVLLRSDGWVHNLQLWRATQTTTTAFRPVRRLTDRSLLVSLLQKAIRRGNAKTAASAALELAHFDPVALVRRLPIVAIEDVSSDRALPTAVWLMLVFSRGISPCLEDVAWMVLYAAELAESMRRDERFGSGAVPSFRSTWHRASSSNDHTALALVVRAAFGGMRGDVNMLLRAASEDHLSAQAVQIRLRDVKRLSVQDAIPEAVDFHCEPQMLDAIVRLHGADRDRIRSVIWHNSSALNVRMPTAHKVEPELWDAIVDDVSCLQAQRIERAFAAVRLAK